jgi:hypothetical protein
MKLDDKKINLFMRGTDAIVAVPMDMVDGDLAEARQEVAHIFSADLKNVVADMRNSFVPPNEFYVWRIKRYERPARLRQPGSQLFLSWEIVNVIPDAKEVSTSGIDTLEMPKPPKGKPAPGGRYVTHEELAAYQEGVTRLLLELQKTVNLLMEVVTQP